MDGFLEFVLVILIIALVVLLGYVVIQEFNLTGTAIGFYNAEYCDPNGCDIDQKSHGEYIYPGYSLSCPDQAPIFQYFLPVGKALMPVYETYNILEGTCQVQTLNP